MPILFLHVPRQEYGNSQELFDQLLVGFRLCFDRVSTYGFFTLNVGSSSLAYYTEKFIHEHLSKHGFDSDSWFYASILWVWVKMGDFGDDSMMLVELSARIKIFFLLLARVVSFNKAHKWYAQVLDMKGEEFFVLQLKCELLAIVDRKNGYVRQILLTKFQKISLLVFSVHANVSIRLYLARIDTCQHSLLLTSENFGGF